MSTSKRQTLSVDLDELFPGDTFPIGDQAILIKPLGLEALSNMYRMMKGWSHLLAEEGVTFENFNQYDSIFKISAIVLANAPEIIEEAANLDLTIIKQLPLEVLVGLVTKIIEVNIKSKEDLAKNFKSLTKILFPVIPEDEKTPMPEKKTPLKKIRKE